ncbi:AMP-binding protein [Kordiimonas marina]|uniref:AMP-binding protein n=1 Tax=Kordiimonas marina TaxID=2872312 RepID=UPI001FF3DE74|nr:AMP-binding protein [Kordiimonas marina]MCJ9429987.1 AMP-binding protein [Kordiimonas marina]
MDSYVKGDTSTPLINITIGKQLEETAARYPDHDAVIFRESGARLTYAELNAEADRIAAGFLALGLAPGDRVGVWAPNRLEWVLCQFATAKAGLIQVNINPAYRLHELEYALNLVECRAIVTAERFKSSDYIAMLQELAPELEVCAPGKLKAEKLPALEMAITMGDDAPAGFLRFADIAGLATDELLARVAEIGVGLSPDDPINIQFTSGTTGAPKGATLSHRNILNNGWFVGRAMGFADTDRLCIPVPLYHCFGMVMSVLTCLTHGAAMIFPAEAFEPVSVLEAVQAEACTALHGVPTMFIAELAVPDRGTYDLSTLRTGIMAGAPCPIEVMKQVISDMHMEDCTIAYGMTETSPVSFQTSMDDPIERRVSTVGRVQPHVEVTLIDTDGNIVPRGTQGEICTRGYLVMQGYWNDPERTAEAIDAEGWMHTGDLGVIDEAGYCNITGRLKDMLVRGGENVYPREIEEFLYRHSAIRDVQVFGVPDHKYGEEICAWVALHEAGSLTEEELKAFCKGQIAHYKVPRYVRFVDDFPMTVTGKIQKFIMREQMIAELDLIIEDTA